MRSFPSWYGGLSPIPIFLVSNTLICFAVSYFIAYGQDHIFPFWPYISDTGSKSPESCYFGQLLNISALFAFLFGVLRYWMMKAYLSKRSILEMRYTVLNKTALIFITLAALGMSMVANFQQTRVKPLHYTGAFLVFVLGSLYVLIETYISFSLRPVFTSVKVPIIRSCIGSLCLLFVILCTTAANIASAQWADNPVPVDDHNKYFWQKGDPGYRWHVVATSSEWAAAFCFLMFFVTMVPEFSTFDVAVEVRLDSRLLGDQIELNNANSGICSN